MFQIENLGKAEFTSPLQLSTVRGDNIFNFVDDHNQILYNTSLEYYNSCVQQQETPACLEK